MLSRSQIAQRIQGLLIWIFVVQIGMIIGVEAVYLAVFVEDPEFRESYNHPTLQTIGIATSLYPICASIGALSVLYLIHLTRATVILTVSVFLWMIGYLVGSLMPGNMAALMTCRAIKGLTIGLITSMIPLYIEKYSISSAQAAKMLTLLQTSVPGGVLLMALIARFIPYTSFCTKWIDAAIPGFASTLTVLVLPSCSEIGIIDRKFGSAELGGFGDCTAWAQLQRDFQNLRRCRRSIIRCIAAVIAQCAGPMTAVNVIFYFFAPICRMIGFDERSANNLGVGLYACNFIGTALSVWLVNLVPKKATIQYSLLGLAVIHFALYATTLGQEYQPNNMALGIVAITLLFGFIVLFSTLFAGISLAYTNDVVSPRLRGVSIGVATSAGWLCNFAMTMVSSSLLNSIGSYIFLLFGYSCCCLFVIFSVLPSTAEKSRLPA